MPALSPLQRRVLAVLARYDGELAVVEIVDACPPSFASFAEEQAHYSRPGAMRDGGFAVRRAIWRLRDRGLIEETVIEVEWSRRSKLGVTFYRAETLAAARLTAAGERETAGLPGGLRGAGQGSEGL